jgi:hypothetical protein
MTLRIHEQVQKSVVGDREAQATHSHPLRRKAVGSVGCAMYGAAADVASHGLMEGRAGRQSVPQELRRIATRRRFAPASSKFERPHVSSVPGDQPSTHAASRPPGPEQA